MPTIPKLPRVWKKRDKAHGIIKIKCHPSKGNFKKMNQNSIECSIGCFAEETQLHLFEECKPILGKVGPRKKIKLDKMNGTLLKHK